MQLFAIIYISKITKQNVLKIGAILRSHFDNMR